MAVGWTARVWRAVETVQDASGRLCGGRVRTTEAMGWVGGMLAGVGEQARAQDGLKKRLGKLKATLEQALKAQHEGALPPPCIVRKDPRVPHTARRGAGKRLLGRPD